MEKNQGRRSQHVGGVRPRGERENEPKENAAIAVSRDTKNMKKKTKMRRK